MRVLRFNRESVMTMLSAFVHDPLITWALFKQRDHPSAEVARGEEKQIGEPTAKVRLSAQEDTSFIGSYVDGGQSVSFTWVFSLKFLFSLTS